DVIGLESESVARIRAAVDKRCSLPAGNVMVACSHTHCAPATLNCLGENPHEGFLTRVEDATVDCLVAAFQNMEPVELGMGCGSAHFNINRRPLPGNAAMVANYGGLVDRRVRVLRVEKADGAPLAVLFHYSCHPTSLPGSLGFISPDYPGVARMAIEETLDCSALFLPGCFGNIRPAIFAETGAFGSATKEQLESLGQELGQEVCRVARSVRTVPAGGILSRRVEFEMPFGDTKSREELKGMVEGAEHPLHTPWAKKVLALVESNSVPSGEPTEMQSLRIGPVAFVGIPGEPFQEIGHEIEKRCRGVGGVADLWPVGYANDDIGYLCTDQSHLEGGYEPGAYVYYDRPARFVGEEGILVEKAVELVSET
ncbi:MAG: neutral/alkaline non-lysosomal ceramidase N-terminal domain-containing protein, partial [Armatimonadetes bacterium]|nr:neutral/alkaline non-lysosomal ceramidase N-terminal domain-containing protein [Armatimonadota bacterium]